MLPREENAREVLLMQLNAVAGRIVVRDLLAAGAIAAGSGAVVNTVLVAAGVPLREAILMAGVIASAVIAAAVLYFRDRWTGAEAARLLERHQPESRNVIVTAEELARVPERAAAWMAERVFSDAASLVSSPSRAMVVPLGRPIVYCVLATFIWIAAGGVLQRGPFARGRSDVVGVPPAASEGRVGITTTITPPAYLGAADVTYRDPDRIEAVAGSRLSILLEAEDSRWHLRLGESPIALATMPGGGLSGEVTLDESTYLAVQRGGTAGAGGAERRLIPVIVAADRTPTIRIERPGKDLLLREASSSLSVGSSASDDFGLRALALRYTRVSGSGEQFEFREGTVPLVLERANERSWRGAATLALPELNLQPGDALVYRVVGHDARGPDAGGASSETFLVEIAAPGQPTLAGFELPPDRDRYALSQQMIVLRIRRLLARQKSQAREAVREQSEDIAAEQRAVRANFIFLTGGHVEDEEQEAAHSHEIQEGRLEHSARREISNAIGHMSRAEQALAAVNPSAALPHARAAVEALQRAFGKNRYLLRSLPVRGRIDPSRRLTGELGDAEDARRRTGEPLDDPAASTARRLVAALLDSVPRLERTDNRSELQSRIGSMAEQALAVDPASPEWHQISASLLQLRTALSERRPMQEVRSRVQHVIALLLAQARGTAVPASDGGERERLRAAWAMEHRK